MNRPAVTNWARRHDDFPQPVASERTGTGAVDTFRASDVAAWLATRRIPVGGLQAGELEGTTYGDRFLASLGVGSRTSPQTVLTHILDRLRGESTTERVLDLLIAVTYVIAVRSSDELSRSVDVWWAVRRTLAEDGIEAAGLGGPAGERWWQERSADFAAQVLVAEGWDRDTAIEAFDWLVEQRSGIEGRRGSDLVTPKAVRRLMAELLSGVDDGAERTILDPFCRTGEILDTCAAVERERAPGASLALRGVSGGAEDATLARMRLTLRDTDHAVDTRGFWWPEPGQRYSAVVSNPPFNQRTEEPYRYEGHFPYGTPPRHSGNFAWLQLAVSALAPGGRAAVLMPNIAAQSANPAERAIRAAMVESGAVEALVALPPQLFGRATSIPVTLWLLRSPTGVPGDVLFVDGASLGSMADRVRRVLSAADVASVVDVCLRWRSAQAGGKAFSGRSGFSASVSPGTLAARDWLLSPVLHVAAEPPGSTSDVAPRIGRLIDDLARRDEQAREADGRVREILSGLEKEGRWRA
ncbi:N-6 DNA methylase [Streptomyces sp. NPDC055815]